MFRHHGYRSNNAANFQQLYTARFVPMFLHLILLILIFVYRVRQTERQKCYLRTFWVIFRLTSYRVVKVKITAVHKMDIFGKTDE